MNLKKGEKISFKTVSAKAVEISKVLRLSSKDFLEVLSKHPDYLVRITQMIMIRLQRVTFSTLHFHLDLTSEMMSMKNYEKKKTSKSNIRLHNESLKSVIFHAIYI